MSPWRSSAVNRKVGGSSPPGDDPFGLARKDVFFQYLNFIISVILLLLHSNKEIWQITFLVTIVFMVLIGSVAEYHNNSRILT